ncbi:hypothetical protein A7982_12102 [Minicystis rosea]|nr:hypothetical protein A7982_12102 [Minicystis rosea]
MSEQRLGRDVFLALAAIGWADGKLDEEEADAIVRTALEEGLEIDEIGEIEKATKAPIDLSIIDRSNMTKADRLFVYAVASWMTRLDGKVHERETEALQKLGELLKIPERPRAHADAIALEIVEASSDRAARYDLPALRTTLRDRLAEAQRLRAAAGEQE